MKNNTLLIGLVFILILGCEKNIKIDELSCSYTNFKYYNNEAYSLGEMSGDYILIGSDSSNTDNAIRDFVKSKDYFDQNFNFEIHKETNYKYKYIGLKLNRSCNCREIAWILNDIGQNSVIDYAHYTTQTDDCTNLIWETIGELCVNSYSNIFYVQVKDTNDISDLNNTILETNTMIRGQNQFMSDWYSLYADKNSNGDALQMANYFYETGLFEASEPDIIKLVVK